MFEGTRGRPGLGPAPASCCHLALFVLPLLEQPPVFDGPALSVEERVPSTPLPHVPVVQIVGATNPLMAPFDVSTAVPRLSIGF
jgi:hypothetical protein